MSDCLKAAIDYAGRGFSVIPIRAGTKDPLVLWKEYQTRRASEDEIREWFGKWPDAQVGIVTGAISGLVVLDCDSAEGMAEIEKRQMPISPIAKTARGTHRYFRHPGGGLKVKNKAKFLPGLDCRADGGFVVAPPSRHPSGAAYEWIEGLGLNDVDLPDCPSWMLDLLVERPRENKPPAEPVGEVIPEGQRNDTLASLAGSMRHRGMSPQAIEAGLQAENLARCRPPLDPEEVRRIAESVGGYEPADPALTEEGRPIELLSHAELVRSEPPPVNWTVDRLIPQGGVTIIGGDAGVGKSWIGLHLAQAVASGLPLFGQFAVTQGRVLIVDAESSQNLLARRVCKLYAALQEDCELDADLPVKFMLTGLRLNHDGLSVLAERIQADGVDLVVIDPLIHALAGDENSSVEIAAMFERVRAVQRLTGASFVFIHHSRKESRMASSAAGQMLRGSSAIRGVLDSHLFLRKMKDGKLLAEHDKSRHAEALPSFLLSIEDISDKATAVQYAGEAEAADNRLEIAEAIIERVLIDNGGECSRQWILEQGAEANVPKRTLERALKEGAESGWLAKRKEGKGTLYEIRSVD